MKTFQPYFRYFLIFILPLFLIGSFVSCEDDEQIEPVRDLSLDMDFANVVVGKSVTLTPVYNVNRTDKEYRWTVSDSSIIEISSIGNNFSAVVTAVGEGSAEATIVALDGSEQATATIETTWIRETEVSIPASITAYTQAKVTITPEFDPVSMPTRSYSWSASTADVIQVTVTNPRTYAAEIQGLNPGTTELTLASDDGVVAATTTVTVEDENDGVTKILAIGNSFSEDAVEYYLSGLARETGKEIVIGNLYIGGATLEQHVANATGDIAAYSYRKVGVSGNKTTTADVSIATAIADENWDYISFQQVSQNSGQYETFTEDLPTLYDYVNQRVENSETKYLLHQTWAYAQNSTHSGFPNYDSDQMTMYEAIVDAYEQAANLIPVHAIVPSGTAIQNARTSYLGDNFNRDGYHLNEIGRYTASSTWYEVIFGESVVGNSYVPDGFVELDAEIAQQAAHAAVQNPSEVTELTDYQSAGGDGVLTSDVLIDFATSSNSAGWNGMTSFLEGATIPNLKYMDDSFTGIEATITSRFNGQNTNGEQTTSTDLNMPSEVSGNSFFGNSKQEWSAMLIEKGVITLSGFQSDDAYEFCFFGSRTATDNRETKYTVIGATTGSASINTASNTENLACISGIAPDANGEIMIEVTAGDNNDNSFGFYYLNAMRISPEE